MIFSGERLGMISFAGSVGWSSASGWVARDPVWSVRKSLWGGCVDFGPLHQVLCSAIIGALFLGGNLHLDVVRACYSFAWCCAPFKAFSAHALEFASLDGIQDFLRQLKYIVSKCLCSVGASYSSPFQTFLAVLRKMSALLHWSGWLFQKRYGFGCIQL